MRDELYKLIMKVDFKQAENIFLKMPENMQQEVIDRFACDTGSMIFYSFIQYLNEKNEKILYHEIAFGILWGFLCHIEGCYQIAFYHNQRLLELVPQSLKYREWMLTFYDDKIIDADRAKALALEVLTMDEDNKMAKYIMKQLEKQDME